MHLRIEVLHLAFRRVAHVKQPVGLAIERVHALLQRGHHHDALADRGQLSFHLLQMIDRIAQALGEYLHSGIGCHLFAHWLPPGLIESFVLEATSELTVSMEFSGFIEK
ncbi:hypothetical protein [Ralstonia edaphi]|uniref:hypothetical protein n=1 Tax=Ralstonia edaphi TaxID=3058599 RepID=UPI002930114B|nr:hypothetical protein [Ralstonia sp. LMG 6871]